jgi:RsiW-degrading membrane proteinase PrsW (M82 family)
MVLRRNFARQKIRERYGIYGSGVEDCWGSCCCACCSACQEAREAKMARLPARDYCSGELLVAEDSIDTDDDDIDLLLLDSQQEASLITMLGKVSKTSKFLVAINAVLALLACIILIVSERAQNIVVLLLVFVQPVIILYFMYWKWLKAYSSLDYVIKMFTVGFWFTTFQSVVIESILQVVLGIVFSIIMVIPESAMQDQDDDGGAAAAPPAWALPSPLGRYLPLSAQEAGEEGEGEGEEGADSQSPPPIFFFMLYQLCTAYVLAAGTEETMKHFAVRCCQFPAALKSPQAVLMYLFAAALGFATSENIEYVFGVASATKQSRVSAMEEELFVLVIRVLMPVHLICSVLQASSLSTVLFVTILT